MNKKEIINKINFNKDLLKSYKIQLDNVQSIEKLVRHHNKEIMQLEKELKSGKEGDRYLYKQEKPIDIHIGQKVYYIGQLAVIKDIDTDTDADAAHIVFDEDGMDVWVSIKNLRVSE